METRYEHIRRLGGEVLAISFTRPEKAAIYLQAHPVLFVVLSDPERTAYRAFELGRATWLSFLRPRVIGGYLARMLGGWMPGKPAQEEEDLLQLGGDFVLDADRRLVYVYRSADATDRPTVELLVQAVEAATRK